MGRRKGRKKGKVLAWLAFLAAVAAIVAIAYFIHAERQREQRRAETPARAPVRRSVPAAPPAARREMPRTAPAPALPEASRRVVIIIDDIGHDLAPLKELLALEAPLTFAVLPDGARAGEAARMIHARGREVLLHLPLEPKPGRGANPGAMVLRTDMDRDELLRRLEKEVKKVPYARGANGHMGSRFTEDAEKMAVLLKALRDRGFYFVDSRTTSGSRAREAARRTGIAYAERGAFIDGTGEGELLEKIRRLAEAADPRQPPVVIGHPYPGTVRSLQRVVPRLRGEGIQVVSASAAVRPVAAGNTGSP